MLFPLSPSVLRLSSFCFRGFSNLNKKSGGSIELLHGIVFFGGVVGMSNFAPTSSSVPCFVFVSLKGFVVHVCSFWDLPQSSHIPLCFAAGAEWVYVQGSMVLREEEG